MSEKEFFPIHIAFFKGFLGITATIILFYYSTTINTLIQNDLIIGFSLTRDFFPLVSFISDFSLFGLIFFPIWYWIIYPIALYLFRNIYEVSDL